MELVTKVEAATRVSASLTEDGALSLKVFASADYAKGRSATAELPVAALDPEKVAAVKAALQAVLEDAAPKLGAPLTRALVKSAEVSAAHGEI